MSRPLRIEYENAFYHVMNRGRGRRQVFLDATYYESFLECMKEAHVRFGMEVHAYCLMGNHYHLLISTPRGNLSRVMRHVNGVYTVERKITIVVSPNLAIVGY
ncbi:MAG: transposase [Candidatus Thiodiazotropha sp. (ex Lucinoma kastoroae)]|nr:transposase [Candidatus Thiodiazotropha sp. (ex Lucinoma kastoroae)]